MVDLDLAYVKCVKINELCEQWKIDELSELMNYEL